jgi:hypothetical protein
MGSLADLADPGLRVREHRGGGLVEREVALSGEDPARLGPAFKNAYAPSTLGSFLRSFTFGHVRQLDAVASRFLARLAEQTPLTDPPRDPSGEPAGRVMLDIDDTIEVHGYTKQGSGYSYSGVRGLTALLATVSTKDAAPVVVARRLRKGSCGSPRGAKRLVADSTATRAMAG